MFARQRRRLVVLAAAAFMAACGGTEQSAPVPSSMTVVSGDGQSGVVGSVLGSTLTVRVLDDMGDPVAGLQVSWAVGSGGGSVAQASTATGSNGEASTQWTLGGTAGNQAVTATASSLSASFSATAEAGPAAQVAVTAAAATLDALGATTQLTGQVQDAFGNPLAGDVTWASADEAVVTVDAAGLATAIANGAADVTATHESVSGSATLTVAQAAANVVVTPANPVTAIAGTIQLAASVTDANDNAMADATVSWSSATESVATVASDGLVTGVAEGQADVTATSGSATGTVTVTVTAAPFEPTSDITIDGDISAASISIPAGVTATLTGDATLSAAGDIDIAGTLTGDCVGVAIVAGGALTLTGDVMNGCSDPNATPTDVDLRATGAINVSDVTFNSAGNISISNDPATGAPRPIGGPASASAATGTCLLSNLKMNEDVRGLPGAQGSPAGGDGTTGRSIALTCTGALTIAGGVYRPGHGGDGGRGFSESEVPAIGGSGAAGGSVVIVAPSILFKHYFGSLGPEPVTLFLASGGLGGRAEAQSTNAVATGGDGGSTGLPIVIGDVTVEGSQAVKITAPAAIGLSGAGGTADALGTDGAAATATTPAEKGSPATATGGAAGWVGGSTETNLIGDVFPANTTNPENIFYVLDNAQAGRGGYGEAGGGRGGNGSEQFKDGGDGGDSEAHGGQGGSVTLKDNRSGLYMASGGDGGFAVMGFPAGISLRSGDGGHGWSDCKVGSLVPGGVGGRGSIGRGTQGQPGMRGGVADGNIGGIALWLWGIGGDGGDGAGPGAGGVGGDLSNITPPGTPVINGLSLQDGVAGNPCETGIAPAVSVTDDKNGHAPFIALAPTNLTVTLGANGAITISGNGNWITVTGTVDADGAFQTTGTGSAAGFSGVAVSYNGQLSLDSDGRVTGVASGTLTMDTNNNVFPPNSGGQRNPAVYSVTGASSGG